MIASKKDITTNILDILRPKFLKKSGGSKVWNLGFKWTHVKNSQKMYSLWHTKIEMVRNSQNVLNKVLRIS